MDGKYIILIIIPVLCIAWQAQCAVNCTTTGAGRFPDPEDTKCKNYTYCISVPPGYVSYNYTCPSTSLFNPKTGKCTTDYTCNATSSSNTTQSFCKEGGLFPDPNVTDCSSYIQCVDINGSYFESQMPCPNNTYYNPNTTKCDVNYKCPSPFKCTSDGRFPNTSDKDCKTYYFCVQLSDDTYVKYKYACPSISVFSPTLRLCTTSYTCPKTVI